MKTNCTECISANNFGLPDKMHCVSCVSGVHWQPLNASSVNPNVTLRQISLPESVVQQALDALNVGIMKMNALGCAIECMPLHYANKALREALAESVVEPVQPPFGSKRKAAMAVYAPPFRFGHGYIYDSQKKMVADDAQVEGAVASRVRGWGVLGYMPNGAALQDEIGQMIADALNAYYAPQPSDVPLLTAAEILAIMRGGNNCNYNDEGKHVDFARAVEQAVRQKAGIK